MVSVKVKVEKMTLLEEFLNLSGRAALSSWNASALSLQKAAVDRCSDRINTDLLSKGSFGAKLCFIVKNEWEMLDCSGDGPEELEEHSMVAYKSLAPANRKGHSAVVYHSSMYIYGGYFGIKGISQEFWTFHFVVYRTGMYLFGGLLGLSEQKDLWKWDFVSSSWSNIRTSQGPPPVVGHASIVCKDSMLIFGGGISNSSPNDDLWKYHFHMQTWKKLTSTAKVNFPPKTYHCILGIGVDFQTTSDSANTLLSHWKNEQDHRQQVPIPRNTRFSNYFRQRPTDRALSSEESNAIEMKTFSLPLEPAGSRAFQTTSEAELDPKRDTSLLPKDKSLPLFASSERETFAAAQIVGEEEGRDCGCVTTGDELSSSTNTLLLIGGKPLSSFAEISFRQMEFDSL
ncbi:leucine-zipper-like transcriptional regulator 1 [Willisornis vidua]|uniref:Leucine-zipper-like transcriptional regulator 1 n=1 Tax=Willisornis vidua TaxID=1566151 RepID=A0ABQ9CWK1_9PASS|nr:leucine-zipper-like transcriptional regulator 1 [Willisornis vidua]